MVVSIDRTVPSDTVTGFRYRVRVELDCAYPGSGDGRDPVLKGAGIGTGTAQIKHTGSLENPRQEAKAAIEPPEFLRR